MKREQSCCFTGHRPDKLPWGENESDSRCLALKRRLEEELTQVYNRGYRHFICGMARGCDLYFCEAVLELRSRRPGITLEAAIPCEEQAARWRERDRSRYFRLMEQCDFETMVQHRYTSGCMPVSYTHLAGSPDLRIRPPACPRGRAGPAALPRHKIR